MSKHIMEPDPNAESPSLATILWVIVFVIGVIVVIGIHGR